MGATRVVTIAAVLLVLAGSALAQGGRGQDRQPSGAGSGARDGISHVGGDTSRPEPRPDALAPPQSTLWSENAMRSLRPLSGSGLVRGGLTSPRPGIDQFRARPDTYSRPSAGSPGRPDNGRARWRPRDGSGSGSRARNWGTPYPVVGGLYVPAYAYGAYGATTTSAAATEATTPAAPTGFLRLLVTPRRADVIVDNIYEGTVDDFGGTGERALPSGVHRVRLEAEGYEPVEFDVRIPDNDTITLRRDLYPHRELPPPVAAPAPPAAPLAPKTIYVIPRCYLGDTPPRADQLPAGCSIASLRTLP